MGHGPHSFKLVVICIVLLLLVFYVLFTFVFYVLFAFVFYVLFACKCVLYHCHRVLTQLQLTNISYHITSHHIISYIIHIFEPAKPTVRS